MSLAPVARFRARLVLACALLASCLGRPQLASEVPLHAGSGAGPDAPCVIALHGSGERGASFAESLHLPELSRELGFRWAAPDARTNASFFGTGWLESDETRLVELVDRMGGEARLVGYSSGGFQACYLALKYPERFPKVCVIAAGILERHVELLPEPERRPEFWFVAGEDDDVVPLEEGQTPIGRSLDFEGFLGPAAAARLVAGRDEPLERRELDLVHDGGGWKPFGPRYAGAETRDLDYGRARLSIVGRRGHLDELGPEACAAMVRWLVE